MVSREYSLNLAFSNCLVICRFNLLHITNPILIHYFSRPETDSISDATLRSIADKYLAIGESVFDMVQGTAVNSNYFKRNGRPSR